MFKVTRVNEARLDIELSGKLDSEAMRLALDDLERESQDIENGIMVYDIVEFYMPSVSAIAIEFVRLPSLFRLIKKFRKAAVLSDTNWIKKASELEGLLIPGLEIKAFNRKDKAEAEDWLAQ